MECGIAIPAPTTAFMLLKRAGIDEDIKRNLILAKVDHENERTLYDQMEARLIEVLNNLNGLHERPQ